MQDFSPDNICNVDKAGLFYKCLLDKTFTLKGQPWHGGKLSKDRATVLVCANIFGIEKLSLLLIGKSRNPKSSKGIENLPVNYQNNNKPG